MARTIRPLIWVFCEGESEQAYAQQLKKRFEEKAIIKIHPSKGLFESAIKAFENDPRYRNYVDTTDEVWFFFDTEVEKGSQWPRVIQTIKKIRKLRRTKIQVRLLMTTACVEYWFLLHYEFCCPGIVTAADKEKVCKRLESHVPQYRKGDETAISHIAESCEAASENGRKTLLNLADLGLPGVEDTDARNEWLFKGAATFTTVHEAIEYLATLK